MISGFGTLNVHKLDAIVQKLLQQLQASQVENGDNAFWLVYGSGRR